MMGRSMLGLAGIGGGSPCIFISNPVSPASGGVTWTSGASGEVSVPELCLSTNEGFSDTAGFSEITGFSATAGPGGRGAGFLLVRRPSLGLWDGDVDLKIVKTIK